MGLGRMPSWWACEWMGEKKGTSKRPGGQRRGGGSCPGHWAQPAPPPKKNTLWSYPGLETSLAPRVGKRWMTLPHLQGNQIYILTAEGWNQCLYCFSRRGCLLPVGGRVKDLWFSLSCSTDPQLPLLFQYHWMWKCVTNKKVEGVVSTWKIWLCFNDDVYSRILGTIIWVQWP